MLQYDGLYVSRAHYVEDDEFCFFRYLRFYADGLVLETSSTGQPHAVIQWLQPDTPHLATGIYTVEDEQISFDVRSDDGVVEFRARFEGDQLLADIYSHIQVDADIEVGAHVGRGAEQYRFVRLSENQ